MVLRLFKRNPVIAKRAFSAEPGGAQPDPPGAKPAAMEAPAGPAARPAPAPRRRAAKSAPKAPARKAKGRRKA